MVTICLPYLQVVLLELKANAGTITRFNTLFKDCRREALNKKIKDRQPDTGILVGARIRRHFVETIIHDNTVLEF